MNRHPLAAHRERRLIRQAFRAERDENGKRIAVPKIERVRRMPDGVKLAVTLPAGQTFRLPPQERDRLEARYASLLRCRAVRLIPSRLDGRAGFIRIYRGAPAPKPDYLKDPEPWPGGDNVSEPIPAGMNEDGRAVGAALLYNNLLIGGIPGSGKSKAMRIFLAAGAQDPTVTMWLIDGGGGVDLAFWAWRAERFVGPIDPETLDDNFDRDAFLAMAAAELEIKRRMAKLLAEGREKVDPADPKLIVYVDELATLTVNAKRRNVEGEIADPKEPGETVNDKLATCLRLSRKVGVIFVLATQRPSKEVVDPNFRDLIGFRLALYCTDGTSSNMILGAGWASRGFNAARLNPARKGEAFFRHESGSPERIRCFDVTNADIAAIRDRFLAPPVPLAHGSEALSGDLCLENGENVVAMPVNHAATPAATPAAHVPDDWDRALLAAAVFPRTDAELFAAVPGKAPSTARKARKALVDAGLLSALPRPSVTAPQSYQTTLLGRTAMEVSITPDGPGEAERAENQPISQPKGAQ